MPPPKMQFIQLAARAVIDKRRVGGQWGVGDRRTMTKGFTVLPVRRNVCLRGRRGRDPISSTTYPGQGHGGLEPIPSHLEHKHGAHQAIAGHIQLRTSIDDSEVALEVRGAGVTCRAMSSVRRLNYVIDNP